MFRVGKQATRLVLIYNTIFTHLKVRHLRKVGFNIGFSQLPVNFGATKQASSAWLEYKSRAIFWDWFLGHEKVTNALMNMVIIIINNKYMHGHQVS